MSVCDRLRTENMRAAGNASPASTVTCDSDVRQLDSDDVRRMNTALQELRGYCRTEEAVKSFNVFEDQLRQNSDAPSGLCRRPAIDAGSDASAEDADRIRRARLRVEQNLETKIPLAARRGSRIPTPVKTDSMLPNIFSRLALPKSMTTSNLTTLSNFGAGNILAAKVAQTSPADGAGEAPIVPIHARRKSGVQITEHQRKEALKDREDKAKQRVAETQRRISDKSMIATTVSSPKSNITTSYASKPAQLHRSSLSVPSNLCQLPREVTARTARLGTEKFGNFEGRECSRPAQMPAPRNTDTNTEQQSKVRRKPQRQSSGDLMKGLFDAGISQVKRMGRRVGGNMSWTGSAEDVSTTLSPKNGGWK
jgi:hypothetical protein